MTKITMIPVQTELAPVAFPQLVKASEAYMPVYSNMFNPQKIFRSINDSVN